MLLVQFATIFLVALQRLEQLAPLVQLTRIEEVHQVFTKFRWESKGASKVWTPVMLPDFSCEVRTETSEELRPIDFLHEIVDVLVHLLLSHEV